MLLPLEPAPLLPPEPELLLQELEHITALPPELASEPLGRAAPQVLPPAFEFAQAMGGEEGPPTNMEPQPLVAPLTGIHGRVPVLEALGKFQRGQWGAALCSS